MAITLIFCCMCISISLLFITVGSAWGSIFPGGRTRGMAQNTANAAYATNTTTTPGLYASPTTAASVTVPNPCVTTATGMPAKSPRASATTYDGRSGGPGYGRTATPKPSPTHAHPSRTPTPVNAFAHPVSYTNPTGNDANGGGDTHTHCDIDAGSHSYRDANGCRNAHRYIHAHNDADCNGIANARCFQHTHSYARRKPDDRNNHDTGKQPYTSERWQSYSPRHTR